MFGSKDLKEKTDSNQADVAPPTTTSATSSFGFFHQGIAQSNTPTNKPVFGLFKTNNYTSSDPPAHPFKLFQTSSNQSSSTQNPLSFSKPFQNPNFSSSVFGKSVSFDAISTGQDNYEEKTKSSIPSSGIKANFPALNPPMLNPTNSLNFPNPLQEKHVVKNVFLKLDSGKSFSDKVSPFGFNLTSERAPDLKSLFPESSSSRQTKDSHFKPNVKSSFGTSIETFGPLDGTEKFSSTPETSKVKFKDREKILDNSLKPGKSYEEIAKPSGVKSRLTLPLKKPSLKVVTDKPIKSKPLKSPSAEEISQITAIICKEVPDNVNNKQFMTEHFSKFGRVKSTRCSPKKKHTIVRFFDHQSARAAKSEGTHLGTTGPVIYIFWFAVSSKSKDVHRSSSDVDDELLAMGGDLNEPIHLTRPETPRTSLRKATASEKTTKKKPEGPGPDESLHSILERAAVNVGDRYKILDARDKLMRMKMPKQSDIKKAIAVVGSCPDMCPEKERYSRADKYGLSIFEQHQDQAGNNVMNPKAAVKEYSRSSADQEEPLSHELRPPQALNLTMDYLLCNIMDLNMSAGEWFDFIWNRTRAIRKDITQQHLCDPVCVALVEKCVRFHIHCAAALCHEDITVFDPKINDENMTKCLQTLKHFYHDLSEKGIFCSNEAEFMAYDILLNLNESDIIRQIQQFRESVRKSDEVRFAAEVFSVHGCNNYVRFFRLVHNTSYLNACILQRYFFQVRTMAISAICKAYRKPSTVVQFSLSDLTNLLGFEDIKESESFCQLLQLPTVSRVGVLLNKVPTIPTTAPTITQATKLIGSKRNTPIGEVVNGGPLPANPYLTHVPHDSFNEEGRLKKNAYDAQDQVHKEVSLEIGIESNPSPLRALQQSAESTQEISSSKVSELILDVYSELSEEVLKKFTLDVSQETLCEIKENFSNSVANQTVATIISDTVSIMSSELSLEVLAEAEHEKAHLEALELRSKVATDISETLFQDIFNQELHCLSTVIVSEAKEELLNSTSEDVLDQTLNDVLTIELTEIANSVYNFERNWASKVQVFMDTRKMRIVRNIFWRWHSTCANRRTYEQVKKLFPAGPLFGFEAAKRIKLDNLSFLNIEEHIRQAQISSRMISADLIYKLLDTELAEQVIRLPDLVKDILIKKCSPSSPDNLILWKLGVYTPFALETDFLHQWVSRKFDLIPQDYNNTSQHLSVGQPKVHVERKSGFNLGISVLSLRGHSNASSSRDICKHTLKGLSGLLIFMEATLNLTDLLKELKTCRGKLNHLLSNKPFKAPVPIVLVLLGECPGKLTSEQISYLFGPDGLHLNSLVFTGLVTQAKITYIRLNHSIDLNRKLEESIQWLALNSPDTPAVISSYLKDFLEDGINTLVVNPVFQDLAYKRKCLETNFQSPYSIVCLYNAAVQFLANILNSNSLKEISWPGPEFCNLSHGFLAENWNESSHLQDLQDIILDLQLEEVPHENYYPFTYKEAYEWMKRTTRSLDRQVCSLIFSQLEKERLTTESVATSILPWAKILATSFSLLLNTLETKDKNGKEIVVGYFEEDLHRFVMPQAWFESIRDTSTEFTIECSLAIQNCQGETPMEVEHGLEESLYSPTRILFGPEYYKPPIQCKALQLSQLAEQTLLDEKAESKAFTQRLQALASKGNSLSPSSYFEPSLFELSATPASRNTTNGRPQRKYEPENLEESFYLVQELLKNEKQSASYFEKKLKLLNIQ